MTLPHCTRCGQPRNPRTISEEGICDVCRKPKVRGPQPATPARCSVLNCRKPIKAREMCENHYRAWRVYGDPFHTRKEKPAQRCSVQPCDRYARSGGMCATHYKQMERTGRTHPIGPQSGGRRRNRRYSELVEEVEMLIGTASAENIAARLRYADADSLITTLTRAGHTDLSRRLRETREQKVA